MDGLIGSYVSDDEEEMQSDNVDEEDTNTSEKIEAMDVEKDDTADDPLQEVLSGEIESTSPGNDLAPNPTEPDESPSSNNSSFNVSSSLPGLVSYASHSPERASKTALTSLLASYENADQTIAEDRDEEVIEKQYDVTVENSDSESDSEDFFGRLDGEGNPKIPSEVRGKCSSKLQEQISNLLEGKRSGKDFIRGIRANKQFRNPSIYDKLIDMLGIQETGTNFKDPLFDKSAWKPDSFYKKLAEKQQAEYDKKESEKKKERGNDPNAKLKQNVIAEKDKKTHWDDKNEAKSKILKANQVLEKINKQMAMIAKNS